MCCPDGYVYSGKFFILLNQIVDASDESYAIDLFDRHDLNIDCSGIDASLARFQNNLKLYDVHQGKNVKIIAGDSTAASIIDRLPMAAFRFVSIDGGHTAEHTINDLNIARKIMCADGVTIVDDIININWMGVIEGVFHFLVQKPVLVPFAIVGNKMLFSNISYHKVYYDIITTTFKPHKKSEFMGHKLISCR